MNQLTLEHAVRERLANHPHFRGHVNEFKIDCDDDVLVLTGRLPSFYLKQMLQEALRDLAPSIRNDVDVICCDGLSSVHRSLARLNNPVDLDAELFDFRPQRGA